MINPEWSLEIKHREDGLYEEYRIPGVAVTQKGTILLVSEARMDSRSDWGRIDVLLERSDDGGKTWETAKLAPCDGAEGGEDDTFNNPTLIVDGGTIHLIFHRNYAQAFCRRSDDDGRTWSRPAEITVAYREFGCEWNCCATGPGHGIALRSGRLVAPIWLANGRLLDAEGRRREHWPSVAGSIYSDDHGATWHAGPLAEGIENANETTLAERADGSVLYNFRSMDRRLRRFLAISKDGASALEGVHLCEALNDPMCFGAMAAMDGGRIAFVHCDVGEPQPDSMFGIRRNLRVHVTADGGETWEPMIDVSFYAGYADAYFHDGCLYVYYEHGQGGIRKLVLNRYRV